MKIRSFISLPASPAAQERIAEIQQLLRRDPAGVKWEQSDKFHMTLRFLGDLEEEEVKNLGGLLVPQLSGLRSFAISYSTLGAFPTPARPRVIWIGIAENPRVTELQHIVEEVCREHRFGRDEARPFHPHITLGRLKTDREVSGLTAMLKTITFEPIEDLCAGVHIMRSDLRPTGSRYTLIQSIPLQP